MKAKKSEQLLQSCLEEINRRMEEAMNNHSNTFSDKVHAYYDGKYAALREFATWLTS